MARPTGFLEFIVEYEDNGELHGYETWAEARAALLAQLRQRFRPFAITCVKYRANGGHRTLWDIEWTDPTLRARREDRRLLREIGAECALDLLKWSPA